MEENVGEDLWIQERISVADVIANGQPESARLRGFQIIQSANDSSSSSCSESNSSKVKISLLQAMEAHRVARG
jgi:hypothetical protein